MITAKRPLKILFLGAMAVGKSSLIQRLTTDTFSSNYKSTLGVALHEMNIQTALGSCSLVLWDTDGEAEDSIFASPYVRGADAAMIVCDLNRPETLDILEGLADGMEDRLPGRPVLGVINKTDLGRPTEQFVSTVTKACGRCVLTSALSGDGVANAMTEIVELCLRRLQE